MWEQLLDHSHACDMLASHKEEGGKEEAGR